MRTVCINWGLIIQLTVYPHIIVLVDIVNLLEIIPNIEFMKSPEKLDYFLSWSKQT